MTAPFCNRSLIKSAWPVQDVDGLAKGQGCYVWIKPTVHENIGGCCAPERLNAFVQSAKTRRMRVYVVGVMVDAHRILTHRPTKAATSWNAASIASRIFGRLPRGMTSAVSSSLPPYTSFLFSCGSNLFSQTHPSARNLAAEGRPSRFRAGAPLTSGSRP